MTEDKMVGWHHRLNSHVLEQTQGESRRGKPGLLQSMGLQSLTRCSDIMTKMSQLVSHL